MLAEYGNKLPDISSPEPCGALPGCLSWMIGDNVVDDDESLQSLFKIFLKKIGFSRIVVGTVKEAIAALEKQHFDILFLDLKLPDGPADDVYDAAKEADPELPIVVITGYPDSEMLDRILAKGPVTVLKKPLKVEQLQQTVRILGHKDAAFVRSHFDAMEIRVPDAPRRDEIVVAVVVTDSGRPLPRVGGLAKDAIKGEDGLR